MDQRACIDLSALPLQILLRRHPEWKRHPAAVVDHDKPQGIIRWVNQRAHACRILPGMRYVTGLALCRDFCAEVVTDHDVKREVARLIRRLEHFSPQIEPCAREPGVFWLAASGLRHVFPSLSEWAAAIRQDMRQAGFESVVAVGFSRFGSYAAAKVNSRNIVFNSPDEEQVHIRRAPIDRLGFEPRLRDKLSKLGISTVGGFIDLPAEGVRKRFGEDVHEWHRLATGDRWSAVNHVVIRAPVRKTRLLDYPETNFDRLEVILQPMVRSILSRLSERRESVSALRFSLTLDDGGRRDERLTTAEPTVDEKQLLSLIRLRMESLPFSSGVVELKVQGSGVSSPERQLQLFEQAPRRDIASIHRAFARIRADLGNDAVVHARLCEGHLPEARFEWKLLERLNGEILPGRIAERPLVRRIYSPPRPLPMRPRHEPDGWIIDDPADGAVEEIIGPHVVSGGWWRREVSRSYHYVRTRSGRWLWVHHDQRRRRWFLHGEVE